MSGRESERAPERGSRQYGPIVRPNVDRSDMGFEDGFSKAQIGGPCCAGAIAEARRVGRAFHGSQVAGMKAHQWTALRTKPARAGTMAGADLPLSSAAYRQTSGRRRLYRSPRDRGSSSCRRTRMPVLTDHAVVTATARVDHLQDHHDAFRIIHGCDGRLSDLRLDHEPGKLAVLPVAPPGAHLTTIDPWLRLNDAANPRRCRGAPPIAPRQPTLQHRCQKR